MLHVWNIYLQKWMIHQGNVGKYSSTMEHLGMVPMDRTLPATTAKTSIPRSRLCRPGQRSQRSQRNQRSQRSRLWCPRTAGLSPKNRGKYTNICVYIYIFVCVCACVYAIICIFNRNLSTCFQNCAMTIGIWMVIFHDF